MSDLPTWDNSRQAKTNRLADALAEGLARRIAQQDRPPLGAIAPTNQHTQEDK